MSLILSKAEKDKLTLLIAYPQEVLSDGFLYPLKDKSWYGEIIQNLLTLLTFVAAKYTRSKVRKALPPQYAYVIEELLYTDRNLPDSNSYFEARDFKCSSMMQAVSSIDLSVILIT